MLEIKQNYDLIAKNYDKVYYTDFNEENLIISLLLDYFIKLKKPKVVSEFGCGTGFWLKNFLDNNIKNIFAFDYSKEMLDICKIKYVDRKINFFKVDFTKTSLILKNDFILTSFFFDAIEYKYFFDIIKNIYYSLNEEGVLFFVDNTTEKLENYDEIILSEKWNEQFINCKYILYNFDFLIETFKKFNFEILFKLKLEDIQIIICKKGMF